MADGPALALQHAIVAALKADSDVAGLVADRVYDDPPQIGIFPYARIGNMDVRPLRTDGARAWTVTFSVEAHSRPVAGRVEASRIAAAIVAALDETPPTVTGYRCAWQQVITSAVVRATDGKSYIATIAFDAVLDE